MYKLTDKLTLIIDTIFLVIITYLLSKPYVLLGVHILFPIMAIMIMVILWITASFLFRSYEVRNRFQYFYKPVGISIFIAFLWMILKNLLLQAFLSPAYNVNLFDLREFIIISASCVLSMIIWRLFYMSAKAILPKSLLKE